MTHSFFGVNRGHSETTTTIRFEGRTAYASTSFHTVSFLTNARDDQLLDTRSNLQSSDLPKSFFTSSVRSDDACNSSTIGIESQVDQHDSARQDKAVTSASLRPNSSRSDHLIYKSPLYCQTIYYRADSSQTSR